MNKGKIFENDLKDSAKEQELFILRIHDTSLSWIKEKQAAFTPKNPCDFLIYRKPYLFFIEAKSTKSVSMGFEIDPLAGDNAMIKAHQIKSLTEMCKIDGIFCGLVLNFRDEENLDNNITYYLPIENFNEFVNETTKKSINKLDVATHEAVKVKQQRKRTHFRYDINQMLDDIIKRKEEK